MAKRKAPKKERKKLVLGDDAIETFETDWFDFRTPAVALAEQLCKISESSGVCSGIIGSWGSGKSSFMKLMDKYVSEKHPSNVCVAWFTAWDPGGIEDLGDAMLYRLFHDISGKNKDLSGAFEELQVALGVRKSIRERARRALGVVSKVVPEAGKGVVDVASSLLEELDAPRKVQESFDKLLRWLEKNDRIVFFFVDDVDRANGEQIRDLLSELKVYISHRRIVAVLGYDEDYVLNALKSPVLPEGIDPKKYLGKIVTIKKNLPMPEYLDQESYAANLFKTMLDLNQEDSMKLGRLATILSLSNPRRLKNLILTFSSYASSMRLEDLKFEHLSSVLVTIAAANKDFLSDGKVRVSLSEGDEDGIISAFKEFAKKDVSKNEEAEALITAVEYISPDFQPFCLERLRLVSSSVPQLEKSPPSERLQRFDWNISLIPILSNAASYGFQLPSETVGASSKIITPSSAKVERVRISDKKSFERLTETRLFGVSKPDVCTLAWNQYDLIILPTSYITSRQYPIEAIVRDFIEYCFSECANFVATKGFILWIIDDANAFSREDYLQEHIKRAQELSKGLKNPFIFQYTPSSKMQALLEFLLDTATGKKGKSVPS